MVNTRVQPPPYKPQFVRFRRVKQQNVHVNEKVGQWEVHVW